MACMLLGVGAIWVWSPFRDIAHRALFVMAFTAVGVFVPDLFWQHIYRRALVPATRASTQSFPRVLTKFAGLLGSVGFVALIYRLFPEYRGQPSFYDHYWAALAVLLPVWAVLALPYLYWVDRRLARPEDSLWQMGRLVSCRWRGLSARVIGQHLLGWLVKGYFLPLMFTYFCDNLDQFLNYDRHRLSDFIGVFDWAFFTLYFIDVGLVSMTYLLSLRLTDTHMRSTEPTMLGWAAALVCYEPFWSQINNLYIAYGTGRDWRAWLGGSPWLLDFWASLILILVAIYLWSTVAFGGRFSNLTHRGIITNGPYRYSKHPAYLSKNLSWWLISMPFMINTTFAEALRHSALLLLLNGIYYLRAKTEERHLALDPVYRQYARWIDAHGALRFVNRLPGIAVLARWRLTFRAYESPAVF